MRRLIFIIIVILSGLTVFGQQGESAFKKNVIKITPFKMLDLSNPAIEMIYERKISLHFSTQFMASYIISNSLSNFGDNFSPNNKGYRIALEEKYYLRSTTPKGIYFSLEFNYLSIDYNAIENFGEKNIYDSLYLNTYYPDSISISKQTYSMNCKIGYQFHIKRFTLDVYGGLGLRYKDVTHNDRIKPEDEMEMPRHPNFYYYKNQEGKYWTIIFPLNVSIGYSF